MMRPSRTRTAGGAPTLTIAHDLRRILLMVVATIALLMTGAFFLLEYLSYRQHVVGTYQTLATTLGINLRPHLTLMQPAPAREVLATLEAEREIEGAFLFDRFDRPMTYYKHPQTQFANVHPETVLDQDEIVAILTSGAAESRFDRSHLTLFTPIFQGDNKLGTLYLVVSLRPFYQRIGWWLVAALTVTGLTILLGLFLARELTRRIANPVQRLADQMAQISTRQDFSVRAELPALIELRTLADSFNAMLEQIASRDRHLIEIQAGLEVAILQATKDLRDSEVKYRALFENSPISLWELDFTATLAQLRQMKQNGVSDFRGHFRENPEALTASLALVRVGNFNQRTLELFAARDAEELRRSLPLLQPPQAQELLYEVCLALTEERRLFRSEGRAFGLDGRELFLSLGWAVLPGHERDFSKVVVAVEDLTMRKQVELELLASLREKETLIREVHHRVKNNLQIISSLIRLQLKRFHDPATVAEMQTTLNRIRSIALVHEKLYQAARQVPDLAAFITDLAHELRRIYSSGESHIEIGIKIEELHSPLSFDLVTSLVMILNELLTNSFKHAFVNTPGQVEITLHRQQQEILLSVADNGCGLPATPIGTAEALGLTLVESLAAQAGGSVDYAGPPGTRVTVRCPVAAPPT